MQRIRLLIAVTCISAACCGGAQLESGTVVIVGYSKQKAIVAADSREVDGHGAYRDQGCKIAALSNKSIFAALGKSKSLFHGVSQWDATREATTALAETHQLKTDRVGDFLDRVAAEWGRLIAGEVGASLSRKDALELTDGEVLVNGIFIGLDEKQELHISHEIIGVKLVHGVPNLSVAPVKVVTRPDTLRCSALGESDVFDEFDAGTSSRTKDWKLAISRFAKTHKIGNDEATAIVLVELTGSYGKEKVPDNSQVPLVGGPTDAAELRRHSTVHWIQRKSQCSRIAVTITK